MSASAATAVASGSPLRPLIVHVVFRFDYGGLENGVVNVINGLPANAFRHAIIALTETSDFRQRIKRPDVEVYALNKQPGKDPGVYWRLLRLLRRLRPTIVHTRNLGTIEGTLLAWLAGVPARIHGEHGWDVYDPDGTNRKYRLMRKAMNPAISRFVTVSQELRSWLIDTVGIDPSKIHCICNGVDTEHFHPRAAHDKSGLPEDVFPPEAVVVGSVTRFSEIKDPLNLVRAFIQARSMPGGAVLRLAMFGDGPLHADAKRMLQGADAMSAAWLPGSRDDVAELMRGMDLFVLGSRREGISNTVLEAMASGLPVIASATGGNLELIQPGITGALVPPGDSAALARTLWEYGVDAPKRALHGAQARQRAEREYSLHKMLASYEQLYRGHASTHEETV